MANRQVGREKFYVEIIKPSHYDEEGYVIQWRWAFVPSNSLACLNALAQDVGQRRALGEDLDLVISTYDETYTVIPVRKIARRICAAGGRGLIILAGVQTNQFARATDLARQFRDEGVSVAIGGFHVSGCLAMLAEMPEELRVLQELGVTLFAGEAEGHMEQLLADALAGRLQPIYNHLKELPDLQGQVTPFLPRQHAMRTMFYAPFDAGRGCPFECSFCTIINVQGRKSRWRSADDVEQLIRANVAQGVRRFFITDDNLARNKNWEAIFDRLITLGERDGIRIKFTMQVDMMCHKIPGFIDKACRAGCTRVFLGLESINPENLAAARKRQNHVHEYRAMLQAWRARHVVTYAGYILGFPADTPESIRRDIATIQRELPIDILEFFVLTPLPGSADHKAMHERGQWMDPDLNRYDVERVTMHHARMSTREWTDIYRQAWRLYYSPEHVETLLRRAAAGGAGMSHLTAAIMVYYGSYRFEKVHPLQAGLVRRKVRASRRPGSPPDNPLLYYVRRRVGNRVHDPGVRAHTGSGLSFCGSGSRTTRWPRPIATKL